MRKFYWLLLLISVKLGAQSQITGKVFSADNSQPIAHANIILYNAEKAIVTYAFSEQGGNFSFSTDKIGVFTLEVRYPNYQLTSLEFGISKPNERIDLGKINISAIPESEIKEVVITRTNPIRIGKDTIEYNALQFSDGTEQNVEELLKKLPGITIDNNGRIKLGKKEVEKVLVENDDIFESGYQTLTQNMPADPIAKVQVLKNYSQNELLKNIENSDRIALNLSLKEEAKSRWFGNILAASTSYVEKMRQFKFNLMNFSKRKKVYLLYNANNLGTNEMNGVAYLIRPETSNQVENVGSQINTLSLINLHRKNSQFEDLRTNFNNDQLASFNYIYNFPQEWKLKFVTIYNLTENRNITQSIYRFNDKQTNFTNVEEKEWMQNNQNIVAKVDVLKSFKNNSSIEFYNKISSLREKNHNKFLFNDIPNRQNGVNRLLSNENRIIFTKKIDSSAAWVTVGRFIYQNRPYEFADENNVFQSITENPNAVKSMQKIDSKMQFAGIKNSYLKTFSEDHTLEIQLADEWRKDDLNSGISVFDSSENKIDFDDSDFKNHTIFRENNLYLSGKYFRKINKWTYNFSLLGEYISGNLNRKKHNGGYLSPMLNISYRPGRTQNITLSASKRISSVDAGSYYTHYIYQGDRSFTKSNLDYSRMPSYQTGLMYRIGNDLSQVLELSINYVYNDRYIANNMIVNPDYTFNQKIWIKDQNLLFADLKIGKYIKGIASRINITSGYVFSSYQNKVNNQPLTQTKVSNIPLGIDLKSGWTGAINYEAGYKWTFNKVHSDINSNDYLDQTAYLNIYYTASDRLRFQSNFEYYKYGNTSQKSTQFWDVQAFYKVPRFKINFFIKANNLLNSNSITRYSLDNVSESIYTQKLLPRHIIFGFDKSF